MYETSSVDVVRNGFDAINSHLVVAVYRVAETGEKFLEDVWTDSWTYQNGHSDFIAKAKSLINSWPIVGDVHIDFMVIPESCPDECAEFSFVVKRFDGLFGVEWAGRYATGQGIEALEKQVLFV